MSHTPTMTGPGGGSWDTPGISGSGCRAGLDPTWLFPSCSPNTSGRDRRPGSLGSFCCCCCSSPVLSLPTESSKEPAKPCTLLRCWRGVVLPETISLHVACTWVCGMRCSLWCLCAVARPVRADVWHSAQQDQTVNPNVPSSCTLRPPRAASLLSPAGPEGLPPGGSCQDEVGERVPRHPLAHQTPQTQRRAHPLRALWMRSLPPPGLPAPRVSSVEELSPPPPSPPLSSTAMRPALAVLPLDLSVVSSHRHLAVFCGASDEDLQGGGISVQHTGCHSQWVIVVTQALARLLVVI